MSVAMVPQPVTNVLPVLTVTKENTALWIAFLFEPELQRGKWHGTGVLVVHLATNRTNQAKLCFLHPEYCLPGSCKDTRKVTITVVQYPNGSNRWR